MAFLLRPRVWLGRHTLPFRFFHSPSGTAVPDWLKKFITEAKSLGSNEWDIKVLEKGTHISPLEAQLWKKFGGGSEGDILQRFVKVGTAYSFPHPHDCPVDCTPSLPASLWWDTASSVEKILIQLGPQYPPHLWLPFKPRVDGTVRLLGDLQTNEDTFQEVYFPKHERRLEIGQRALEREALLLESGDRETALVKKAEEVTVPVVVGNAAGAPAITPKGKKLAPVVPWAAAGSAADLYRRQAMELEAVRFEKEWENERWFWLGPCADPEGLEMQLEANPFVYGRWPIASLKGEQRRANRPVLCSAFRTVHSKSLLVFTVRGDEPHASIDLNAAKHEEASGLYCCVNFPTLPRASGGKAVVERYNRSHGCDFPLDTPVDVLGALSLFQPKATSQVAAEFEVAAGTLLDTTRDVAVALAKQRREMLPEAEKAFLDRIDKVAHKVDPMIASDATHPGISRTCQYIRRLAIMKYPKFEEHCFKPFWSSESKYIRVKVYEAALLAGREDLADILLSRESDPYVVGQIADMGSREI